VREWVNLLGLKKKLYVKKTEKSSLTPSSLSPEPSSFFKGKALVQRVGTEWRLLLSKAPASPLPDSVSLPSTLAVKEGQILEVTLQLIKGKWQVEIPHSQIYQEMREEPVREPLSSPQQILLKMGLPLKGAEETLLGRFLTPSLWARRLIAMGILDKRPPPELALINLFASLTWGEPSSDVLQDIFSRPFPSRKSSPFLWQMIPCETDWGGVQKKRGMLALGFYEKITWGHLKRWSFFLPIGEDLLILKVEEGTPRHLTLFLPSLWEGQRESFNPLIAMLREAGQGELKVLFEKDIRETVDPWAEEDFS
jgi:hypothetical protein